MRAQEVGGRRKLVLMLYGIERSYRVSPLSSFVSPSIIEGRKDSQLINSNDPTSLIISDDIPIPIPPSPPSIPPTFLIGTIRSNKSPRTRIRTTQDSSSEEG